MRILNVLTSFSQFTWSDLFMDQQVFEDFKSKYLDLYDQTRSKPEQEEKASILDEVDFELELIRRDEVNVIYILALLAKLKEAEISGDPDEQSSTDQRRKSILDLLNSEPQLRSKRELIEKFIDTYLPKLQSANEVEIEFDRFWAEERERGIQALCETEGLVPEAVTEIINEFHFTQREPLRETIVSALKEKPKILQRKAIIERVKQKLIEIIGTFDDR